MIPELRVILDGVDDTRVLKTRRDEQSPLNDLIDAYSRRVSEDKGMLPMSEEWTGLHLKNAVSAMSSPSQEALYEDITNHSGRLPQDAWHYCQPESPKDRDERRLKIWIVKWTIVVCTAIIFMIAGGVTVVMLKEGGDTNENLVVHVLDTTMSVIKLIMGPSGITPASH